MAICAKSFFLFREAFSFICANGVGCSEHSDDALSFYLKVTHADSFT